MGTDITTHGQYDPPDCAGFSKLWFFVRLCHSSSKRSRYHGVPTDFAPFSLINLQCHLGPLENGALIDQTQLELECVRGFIVRYCDL